MQPRNQLQRVVVLPRDSGPAFNAQTHPAFRGLGFANVPIPFELPNMPAPVINVMPDVRPLLDTSSALALLRRVPTPVWIVGGVLAAWWFMGRSSKRQARARAKAEYERKLAQIDDEYSTGGRIRRAGRKARRLVPKVSF